MSEDAPAAPAEGPLSVDQGVAALTALRTRSAPAEQAVEAPAAEAAPSTESEADVQAEEVAPEPVEASEGDQPAETQEPEAPVVNAPHWWTAEQKALFSKVPPEVAAVIAEAEATRERVVQATKAEAAERVKAAERDAAGVKALAEELNSFLPQAVDTFKSRWEGVDWLALSREDAGQYVAYKAQFDAEQVELQRIQKSTQEANYRSALIAQEVEKKAIRELIPEFADPVHGPAREQKLIDYLKTDGFDDADIIGISAKAAKVAYKAMLYDAAKASALPKPAIKPAPARTVPPSPSSAANPQHRNVMDAAARLAKSGTTDDAVALLQARRNARK